jgi:hypothetical protein
MTYGTSMWESIFGPDPKKEAERQKEVADAQYEANRIQRDAYLNSIANSTVSNQGLYGISSGSGISSRSYIAPSYKDWNVGVEAPPVFEFASEKAIYDTLRDNGIERHRAEALARLCNKEIVRVGFAEAFGLEHEIKKPEPKDEKVYVSNISAGSITLSPAAMNLYAANWV